MNNAELLNRIAQLTPAEGFERWVGALGYDTRPRVWADGGWKHLPVAHREGHADTGRVYDVPKGDIEGAIGAVSVGGVIVLPDYHGSACVGAWEFTRTSHGWSETYID